VKSRPEIRSAAGPRPQSHQTLETKFCSMNTSEIAPRPAAKVSCFSLLFACCLLGFVLPGFAAEPAKKEIRRATPIDPVIDEPGSSRFGPSNGSRARSEPRPLPAAAASPLPQPRTAEAPAKPEATGGALVNTMAGLNDKRKIGIRDRLSLSVVEDEYAQRPLTVTDSGEVDVPYVGRVEVGDRTCKSLATYVKSLLEREYFYQATVLISLDAAGGTVMSKGRIYINGQVGRPGPLEIPSDEVLTVSKALMRAGGFTQYANRKKVRLMRKDPTSSQAQNFNLNMIDVMEKGQTAKDMEVLPEDTIFVEEKFFNF